MARITSILAGLNPIAAFFGPIFQKEVRVAGRRRSTYVLRTLYCLGLLLILIGAFFGYRSEYSSRSAVIHLQSMQNLAPMLTLVVAWFQFGVLFLAAPVLAAGAVCDERRARTLDVLMTTPLRAGQMVGGKLSSRIVQVVILALLAAPALLAVRVFGGLSAEVVLATSCIAVSTAILGAALAVLFSVRQRRATMAALFAVLSLLLLQAGPAVAEGIRYHLVNEYSVESPYRGNILATCAPATMQGVAGAVQSGLPLPHLVFFHPAPMTARGAATVAIASRAPLDLGPVWAVNTAYNLVLAAIVTMYTTLVLRRAMTRTEMREQLLRGAPPPRRRKMLPDPEPGEGEGAQANPAIRPVEDSEATMERYASRDRIVADNPVLWREVRQATFGSRRLFRVIVCLTIAGLGFLYWRAGIGNEGLHAALAFIACAAVMLQAVFLTSGPYAGEREARTWEVLLTTTLTPGQILRGKMLGALRGFWFIPAVVLFDFALGAALGYIRPIGVLYLAMIILGPAIFLTATGHLLSLRFRKAVTAGALNLGIAIGLWGLSWLTLLVMPLALRVLMGVPDALGLLKADLVVDSFLDDHFTQVVDGIYALNPLALMDTAINPCILESGPRGTVRGPFETGLIQHRLNMGDCTLVVFSVFAFYCLGSAAAMGLARLRFKAWSGRVS